MGVAIMVDDAIAYPPYASMPFSQIGRVEN